MCLLLENGIEFNQIYFAIIAMHKTIKECVYVLIYSFDGNMNNETQL